MTDPYAEALADAAHRAHGGDPKGEADLWHLARTFGGRAEAWHELGVLAHKCGRHEAAATLLSVADGIERTPETLSSLGAVLNTLGDSTQAVAALETSLTLQPGAPVTWNNLSAAQAKCGRADLAEHAARKALELDPKYAAAAVNLCDAFARQNRLPEAIGAARYGLQHEPDRPDLHWNLALSLLKSGDWAQGFREYAWRWQLPEFAETRNYRSAPWPGPHAADDGATVLLHCEQGYGDTIQMLRYVPLMKRHAKRVILEVPAELERLATAQVDGADVVYSMGIPPKADYHTPLLSLPMLFGTTPDDVPPPAKFDVGNLQAIPGSIGYCWRGSKAHVNDANRSATREDFEPLTRCLMPVPLVPGSGGPIDHGKDFHDTAALLKRLSLVVTVDTAVAHLAGTLNVPTVLVLGEYSDWRWLMDRSDTPWYPSVRVVRKAPDETWAQTVLRITEDLRAALAA